MSNLKKILSGLNYLSVYLFILITINCFLLFLPLTKVFGYEFSAVNAIILVVFSGFYTISLLKILSSAQINERSFHKRLILVYTLFLIIPAVISLTHSFFTMSCSLKDGIAFYLVITFPSVLVGFFFGITSFSLTKRFSRILFVLFFLAIFSIPFFEFYYNPQVYFYNPIFGFFPGTIYDEGLSVTSHLLLYRFYNSLFFGLGSFFILYSILKNIRFLKMFFITASLVVAVVFYSLSPVFGFSNTFKNLQHQLGGKVETTHFNIYYPLKLNHQRIEAIALYHEYYYSSLRKFFGYEFKEKFNSYIFLNDSQKKKLFGSANADVAKPWLRSTFISADDYDKTLKHEIAHCYSAKFGTGLFKVAAGFNPFLLEGIAVAADPVYNENNINYMAALAFKYGYKISIKNMLKSFSFFTTVSSVSYIYAGAFVKYLVEKFGIEKFKKLYAGENFEKIYGISIESAENNFYKYLTSFEEKGKEDKANYYFGRKSIFYKICPRYVNDRLHKAWEYYNQKKFTEAQNIFNKILTKTNNYSAVIGYTECLAKLNKLPAAIKTLSSWIGQFQNTAYYYNMELRLADLMSENSNSLKSDSIYSTLVKQDPSRTLFYLANLRLTLSKDTSKMKLYLNGNYFDKYLILKKLNENQYIYSSFPVMIDLSDDLGEDYNLFLKNFNRPVAANDYLSSFAMYRLSIYMLRNLDYSGARKTAAMALFHSAKGNFKIILNGNYKKCE